MIAFYQLLLKVLAILGPILSSPYAAKVLTCIQTQSTVAGMLSCILSNAPAPSAPEAKAHTEVVNTFNEHIAANP